MPCAHANVVVIIELLWTLDHMVMVPAIFSWLFFRGAIGYKTPAEYMSLQCKCGESWPADQNVISNDILHSKPVFIQHGHYLGQRGLCALCCMVSRGRG